MMITPLEQAAIDFIIVADQISSAKLAIAKNQVDGMNQVDGFDYCDFRIEGYNPHPAIKAPIAV